MTTANKVRIGILGASGYTGAELLRLLALHPGVEIRLLTADRQAGKPLSEIFPHLGRSRRPTGRRSISSSAACPMARPRR